MWSMEGNSQALGIVFMRKNKKKIIYKTRYKLVYYIDCGEGCLIFSILFPEKC